MKDKIIEILKLSAWTVFYLGVSLVVTMLLGCIVGLYWRVFEFGFNL